MFPEFFSNGKIDNEINRRVDDEHEIVQVEEDVKCNRNMVPEMYYLIKMLLNGSNIFTSKYKLCQICNCVQTKICILPLEVEAYFKRFHRLRIWGSNLINF